MLYIKDFSEKRVVITDGNNEYVLTATGDQSFDQDLLEDILFYCELKGKEK